MRAPEGEGEQGVTQRECRQVRPLQPLLALGPREEQHSDEGVDRESRVQPPGVRSHARGTPPPLHALISSAQILPVNCRILTVQPTLHALHLTPYTLHPTPYTLHPAPCTLHPASFILRPTPYTLHPTPSILNLFNPQLEQDQRH